MILFSLVNARIYTVTKGVLENGFISIKNGKIHKIGHMNEFNATSKKDIDLSGFTIYPGFIDAHTHLGLIPEGKSYSYDDNKKNLDIISPNFNVLDYIDTCDLAFRDAIKAGITTVAISPGSSLAIAGQISAVKTVNIKNNIINPMVALKIALGENPINFYKKSKTLPYTKADIKNLIISKLSKTQKQLSENKDQNKDLLFKLLNREIPAHFHVHDEFDIKAAVEISNKFNLKYVLIHATEAYKLLDFLKENKAKIIQGPFFTNRSKPELLNMDMKTSAILDKYNLLYSITTDHPELPTQFLTLSVSFAVKHGLSFKKALELITINAAKLCGISNRVGSIEPGKDADLVVFKNNPLKAFEQPSIVLIDGKIVHKI